MTDSEHLYQLVQQKLERLEQLHSCSGNQMRYVETDNMGAVLEILAAKQRLLIEIEGFDRQIAGYHVDDPEERVWPTPDMRERCREMIARCDRLVRETLEFDRAAEQSLIVKKEEARKQLRQFTGTTQVQGAYRQQKSHIAMPAHVRIDLGSG